MHRLKTTKETRDNECVKTSLNRLKKDCENNINVMPSLLDCVRNEATLGEMIDAMKDVFGIYTENPVF